MTSVCVSVCVSAVGIGLCSHTHAYVHTFLHNAALHFTTYVGGLKRVRSFSHVNEMELALLTTCVLMLV